jgi:hypothetical protein
MTSRQLTSLGRSYMRKLGMVEWIPNTKFRFVRNLKDESGCELHGQSTWMAEERQAWIALRPNADDRMLEETTIHELLHILFEGHKPVDNSQYDAGYEFALNRSAKAYWEAWNKPAE